MRSQIVKLLRYSEHCKYVHEQGEPFETCLALRGKLIDALRGSVVMNITELRKLMNALEDAFDNVTMARQRALGQRITISFVTHSQEMDDFVSYLDFLKQRGFPQSELDAIYIETISEVTKE